MSKAFSIALLVLGGFATTHLVAAGSPPLIDAIKSGKRDAAGCQRGKWTS